MLLELVLLAFVLTLVGLAVYQSNHRPASDAPVQSPPAAAPANAVGLAASAAATAATDSATEASISATAETSVDELSQSDTDITNLGGSSATSF